MRKIIGNIVVSFIAALFLLGGAYVFGTGTDVKCGSETMQPGDLCETTRRGQTTVLDYEEQKAANTRLYVYGGLGGGVFFLAYGAWNIRKLVKGKKAAAEAATVTTPSA